MTPKSADHTSTPTRSPPRGPAALRPPPTGPSATRNFSTPATSQGLNNRHPQSQITTSQSRQDTTSPTVPPSGPRGYVAPRGGGFTARGGRGGWGQLPPRHSGPSPSPAPPSSAAGGIPTGPRAGSTSLTGSPSLGSKPFNPPTGPAAQQGASRPTLVQNLMSSMPVIIPGGKIDPSLVPITTGVTKELDPHHRRLKEEEERLREGLNSKEETLRKSLRLWERHERDSKAFELKTDLSEKSLKNIAGEGMGGAAF